MPVGWGGRDGACHGHIGQGVRNVKETIGRVETFKEMAKKGGVAVKDLYWNARQP
jgi:uncharacterized protein with GYD domain